MGPAFHVKILGPEKKVEGLMFWVPRKGPESLVPPMGPGSRVPSKGS